MMRYLARTKILAAALGMSATLALVPGTAEARFGKSGSSGSSSSSSSSGRSSSSSHAATPVGSNNSGGSSSGGSSYGYSRGYQPYSAWCWSDPLCRYRYGYWFGYQPWFGYYDPYPAQPPPPPEVVQQPRQAAFTFGAEAQGYIGGGASLGLNLAFEHDRLGFRSDFLGIFVPANDGSDMIDSIKLVDAHVTYALLASDRGRLRVGAGVNSAFAPDIIMAGPGISVTGVMGLMGPISGEAAFQLTPFPFTQIDWSAGLSLAMGPIGMRAGWRRIYLNDNGFVDGVAHDDLFSGPYVALALSL